MTTYRDTGERARSELFRGEPGSHCWCSARGGPDRRRQRGGGESPVTGVARCGGPGPARCFFPGQLAALTAFTQAVLAKGHWWTRTLAPRDAAGRDPAGRDRGLPASGRTDAPRRGARGSGRPPPPSGRRRGRGPYARGPLRVAADGADLPRHRAGQPADPARGRGGIYGVNAEGVTTFVNPAAARLLAARPPTSSAGTCMPPPCTTPAPTADTPHRDCPIYAAFRDGIVHQVDHEVFWRADGTSFRFEYTSTRSATGGACSAPSSCFATSASAEGGRGPADERARRGRLPPGAPRAGERLSQGGNPGRAPAPGHHRPLPRHRGHAAPSRPRGRNDATVLITGESAPARNSSPGRSTRRAPPQPAR